MESSSYILAGCVTMAAYALPALVAFMRQHPATPRITALNLCLGWTVVGWIGAFFWATTSRRQYRYRLMTISSRSDQAKTSCPEAVSRPSRSVPQQPGLAAEADPPLGEGDDAAQPARTLGI